MKILVTGFKPFLDEKINPSELLSLELAQKFSDVESLILPVEFGKSFEVLKLHMATHTYNYVIMLGLAAGRGKVSLEKIALNWVQGEHRDEAGLKPPAGEIIAGSPLALMTKFPIDLIYTELNKQKLPLEISFSAGTFVCNELYFRVLEQFTDSMAVFIHVPLIEEQITDNSVKPFIGLDMQINILSKLMLLILK